MRFLTILAFLAAFAFQGSALAAGRVLDGNTLTNGAFTLTMPNFTDTFAVLNGAQTFTNKTMDFSLNSASNIPVGAIAGSALSGTNSGDVTAAAFGSTPNANGFSLSGQALSLQPADATHPGALSAATYVLFNGKLSSSLTTGHIYIGLAGVATDTAVSGDMTLSSTGVATLANTAVTPGSYTNVSATVDSKGRITAMSSGTGSVPALNGGSGSPQSVTAAGGISLSGLAQSNRIWIVGSPGAVTVTATPSITACTADSQTLDVYGTDATKTVTLQDKSNLASSGLSMNGNFIAGLDSSIHFHCDFTRGLWVEDSRR
jgi:hypothetical protein